MSAGVRFDPQDLERWLCAPATARGGRALQPLLLYPADPVGASTGGLAPMAAPSPPLADPAAWRLVLLDGTWRQAHRLLHAHPALLRLPRWPLPSPPPSRYCVRKARRADQRSTLEAACLALGALEGRVEHYAPLLEAFDGWVAAQLAWRDGGPAAG